MDEREICFTPDMVDDAIQETFLDWCNKAPEDSDLVAIPSRPVTLNGKECEHISLV